MRCNDPDGCRVKAQQWEAQQAQVLDYAEDLLQRIRCGEFGQIIPTKHFLKRELERAISKDEREYLIRELVWPFEYHKNVYGTEKLGLIGYPGKNRPLHIIMKREKQDEPWRLVTVYDPRSEGFRWSRDYTKRICFCI